MAGSGKVGVMIFHPDFDQGGKAGLQAAQEYAERMAQGAQEIAAQAVKAGDMPDKEIRAYLAGFRYVVRRIPEDLL